MTKPSPITTNSLTAIATLKHLRQLSNLLDNAFSIPGTPLRVGIDAIVGLVPIGGDVIVGIFAIYILLRAVQIGIPKPTLIRMVVNILIDVAVGTVPILGDLFDATWKCHTKNVDLLEAHLQSPQTGQKADTRFLLFLVAGFILAALAILIGSISILLVLLKAITSS